MSVRIDTTLQTYLAAVTIPGDFHGLPDGDFEVALGSYTAPGAFQAPDAVSINSTVSVTLTGRLGAGKSFDPTSGTYWLWGRATRAPDETLTRGSTRITVVTDGGTPVNPAIHYVQTVNDVAPDADGNVDVSGGGGAVDSVNGHTGVVVLAASDVGADTAAARDTAIGVETARAEAAESANATAITSEASTARAAESANATAITSEATTARAAEALKLAKASNLSDLGSAATARTNLGLGTAATTDASAYDAAGAASTAQAAAQTYADGKVIDSIADADTTHAPSRNAVFDALALKTPTSRLVSAGTGLTGGGDLSADRTLTVAYGSTAGTAAQGNDSRIVAAANASNLYLAANYR